MNIRVSNLFLVVPNFFFFVTHLPQFLQESIKDYWLEAKHVIRYRNTDYFSSLLTHFIYMFIMMQSPDLSKQEFFRHQHLLTFKGIILLISVVV